MIKRDFKRRNVYALSKQRRPLRRKRKSPFFLRFFILLFLVAGVGIGGYLGAGKGYQLVAQAQLANWHIKSVSVQHVPEPFRAAFSKRTQPLIAHPFTAHEAVALQQELSGNYPMLKNVSVSRRLLSGELRLSAEHRTPIAQFKLPGGSVKFLDNQSHLYTDPYVQNARVPEVVLEGPVPEQLPHDWVELVEDSLKLKKELAFTNLHFNTQANTFTLTLADGNRIDFGSPEHLNQKAARAVAVLAQARENYPAPFVLNFEFFDQGNVFLRPLSR